MLSLLGLTNILIILLTVEVKSNQAKEQGSKSKIYFKKVQLPPAADKNSKIKSKPDPKKEQIKQKYEDNPVYKSYNERNKISSNKNTKPDQSKNKGVEYSGRVLFV